MVEKTAKESPDGVSIWVNLTHISATMRQIDAPVKRCRGRQRFNLVKFRIFVQRELLAPELL